VGVVDSGEANSKSVEGVRKSHYVVLFGTIRIAESHVAETV